MNNSVYNLSINNINYDKYSNEDGLFIKLLIDKNNFLTYKCNALNKKIKELTNKLLVSNTKNITYDKETQYSNLKNTKIIIDDKTKIRTNYPILIKEYKSIIKHNEERILKLNLKVRKLKDKILNLKLKTSENNIKNNINNISNKQLSVIDKIDNIDKLKQYIKLVISSFNNLKADNLKIEEEIINQINLNKIKTDLNADIYNLYIKKIYEFEAYKEIFISTTEDILNNN